MLCGSIIAVVGALVAVFELWKARYEWCHAGRTKEAKRSLRKAGGGFVLALLGVGALAEDWHGSQESDKALERNKAAALAAKDEARDARKEATAAKQDAITARADADAANKRAENAERQAARAEVKAEDVAARTDTIEAKGQPRVELLTPEVQAKLVAAFKSTPTIVLMIDPTRETEVGDFGRAIRGLVKDAGKLKPEVHLTPMPVKGVVVFADSTDREAAVLADELTLAGIPDVRREEPSGMIQSLASAEGRIRLAIGEKPE